ncbi:hypothetical protein AGMMS50268_09540 [Spirochaetia bacterium]|nr:hypothetical protein AGMMS50268_09540 [Spirochaetia bacterium]
MSDPVQEAQITELIESPDTIEIVRDQIAALLSLELQNQYQMAVVAAVPRPQDYNIKVYVENSRPYDIGTEQISLINILLPKVTAPLSNPRIGKQKEQATFYVDCAADGNASGNFRDDKSATFRAWKIMRLVRRIIMSEQYAYLGLRGTVSSRTITTMESGTPGNQVALAVTVIRSTLVVDFVEGAIEWPSVILEGIDYDVNAETGQVIAKPSLKDRVMGLDNKEEDQNVTSIGN